MPVTDGDRMLRGRAGLKESNVTFWQQFADIYLLKGLWGTAKTPGTFSFTRTQARRLISERALHRQIN